MWHFITCDEHGPYLNNSDKRRPIVDETVTLDGEIVLCEHGLHASPRIIDALGYCPNGPVVLCEVTLGGTIVTDNDKSAASERTIIRMLEPEQTKAMLREFARWCALSVAHLWNMPDVVRQYLETGNESIRAAARVAAEAAARAAAWDAADAAAWDAARDAQNAKLIEMFNAVA